MARSKSSGSRLSKSGRAIFCKSRTPSGVSIGEPASTRTHHGWARNLSTNFGANSSNLSTSSGWQSRAKVSSRVWANSLLYVFSPSTESKPRGSKFSTSVSSRKNAIRMVRLATTISATTLHIRPRRSVTKNATFSLNGIVRKRAPTA